MVEKLKDLIQRRFARNVASMLTGNILSQAIGFLAALVITRLYTPDDFGIMTYIWSLTSIFSVGAGLCYQQAIILPSEEKKPKAYFASLYFPLYVYLLLPFWHFGASKD